MDAKTPFTLTVAYVDEIVAAFNRHDVEAIVNYFTEDGEWYLARGPERHGRCLKGHDEIRAHLTSRNAQIPDMRWLDGKSWVSGDTAMSTWTVQGKTVDGEAIDWWGIDYWAFEGGTLKVKDTYWKSVRPDEPGQL
jgi:ketosteroid isomerase-like protein